MRHIRYLIRITINLLLTAYSALLRGLPAPNDKLFHEFSLRDLDSDGIPELMLLRSDGIGIDAVLTVYSYNNNVYKVGDYSDPKTGVSNRRVHKESTAEN